MRTLKPFAVFFTFLPLVLSMGCIAGQTVDIDYAADVQSTAPDRGSVALTVDDLRTAVVDGSREGSYIGNFRSTVGIPWGIKTDGKVPLADLIHKDLSTDLKSLGYSVPATGEAPRHLKVVIKRWNCDGYVDVKIWYVIELWVNETNGDEIHHETLEEKDITIQGSAWSGPKKAFKKEYPGIYKGILHKIVKENEAVLNALRQ